MPNRSVSFAVALAVCCWAFPAVHAAADAARTDAAIRTLYTEAWQGQWRDDVPFDAAKLQFGHRKGAFASDVHINFVGPPLMQTLRDDVGVPDDNGFLGPFMIDAFVRAADSRPDLAPLNDTLIAAAVEADLAGVVPATAHGGASNVPIFGFWPWQCDAGKSCRQFSLNMNPLMDDIVVISDIILAVANASTPLGAVVDYVAEQFKQLCQQFSATFNIPPDADDTGMNIGISYLLESRAAALPAATAAWRSRAFDYEAAAARLVKYAYCPGDAANRSRSSIDPRSYFWARDFFRTLADPDACIVTTWLQNYDEEVDVFRHGGGSYLMPFNSNNVDPTVATNALYGLTTLLVRGHTAWLTEPKARSTYLTTARFLAWTLTNQARITRPDLETLYYPSSMDVLNFAARLLRLLRAQNHTGAWPAPEMATAFALLDDAMKAGGAPYLLQTAKHGSACASFGGSKQPVTCPGWGNESSAAVACWDGFLGANDTNDALQPTPRYLDRFFTTASAANALISSFVVELHEGPAAPRQLVWDPATPSDVVTAAKAAVDWLTEAAVQPKDVTSFACAFFSGSVHAMNTLPLFFPANTILLMNETSHVVNCNSTSVPFGDNTFQVVQGQIPEADYQRILASGCAGAPSMPNFTGLNAMDSPWPFWSSPPLSKALGMMAIADMSVLV